MFLGRFHQTSAISHPSLHSCCKLFSCHCGHCDFHPCCELFSWSLASFGVFSSTCVAYSQMCQACADTWLVIIQVNMFIPGYNFITSLQLILFDKHHSVIVFRAQSFVLALESTLIFLASHAPTGPTRQAENASGNELICQFFSHTYQPSAVRSTRWHICIRTTAFELKIIGRLTLIKRICRNPTSLCISDILNLTFSI